MAGGPSGKRGASTPGVQKPSLNKAKNAGVLSFFAKNGKSGGFNDLVDGSVDTLATNLARPASGKYGLPGETTPREGKGLTGTNTGGGNTTANIGVGLGTKGKGAGIKGDGLSDNGTGKNKSSIVASIDAESATAVGSLSKDQIFKVIQAHMGAITACYERQLQIDPSIEGKIVESFVIGSSGRVTSASTQLTLMKSPPIESCINGVFRGMKFPSPAEGQIVEASYSFEFKIKKIGCINRW